jgi:hypothetical protein
MKLFINDRLIHILKPEEAYHAERDFDLVISKVDEIRDDKFQGHILLKNCSPVLMDAILARMQTKKIKGVKSIVCLPEDYKGGGRTCA